MGLQFDRIAYSSDASLTFLVNDLARQRDINVSETSAPATDMEDWLNAFLHQAAPLLHSKAGRANLEAWLEQAEQLTSS